MKAEERAKYIREHGSLFALITAGVRYNENLSPAAKLLYGELVARARADGKAFGTNREYSILLNKGERTIRRALEDLEQQGYIKRVMLDGEIGGRKSRVIMITDPETGDVLEGDNMVGVEETEDGRPSYYSSIPANVLYNEDLNDREKLLFAEISSLSASTGYCFALNKHLGELAGIPSNQMVSRSIRKMKELGLIEAEYTIKNGEVIGRKIRIKAKDVRSGRKKVKVNKEEDKYDELLNYKSENQVDL